MRTGSYLLCEALEWTGRAGHPREIFCPERREMYAGEWKLPDGVAFDDFLPRGNRARHDAQRRLRHQDPSPSRRAARARVRFHRRALAGAGDVISRAKYIHLRRRDRRGQAISWYRAELTNEWWRIAGVEDTTLTGTAPEFHGRRSAAASWSSSASSAPGTRSSPRAEVAVIDMDYETLKADYRSEVARVLEFIGEDPALARGLPEPRPADPGRRR